MISRLKRILQKLIGIQQIRDGNREESKEKEANLTEYAASSKREKRMNDLIMLISLGAILIIGVVFMKYKVNSAGVIDADGEEKVPLKLEVASAALDAEKMWRNHFEDKLTGAKLATEEKLKIIEASISEQSNSYSNELRKEIQKLKAQLEYLSNEQESSKRELSQVKAKSQEEERPTKTPYPLIAESRITVNRMERGELFDRPKSARSFIPETAYIKGVLLGGIAVSTALGSASEPVPVVIRITERGSLPKNFNIDLTNCKVMGSSYGDLSSERAIVRAEVLSCTDPKSELVYTTRIAGLIHGDDGMNGIKGRVVQTSGKHLKNAMIGGMISGFTSSAKGQDPMIITGFGSSVTKKKGMGDMLKEGGFAGASNAAEKIADYYIKQAEAMSPVLLVSGGTKVDIVFTKGVYLNALDVEEKLEQLRSQKDKK